MDKIKRALVESYIGAIALGYLLAMMILEFVDIFASPVGAWVVRSEWPEIVPGTSIGFPARSPFKAAIPHMATFLVLLVVWYVLLRWLYLGPSGEAKPQVALDVPETDS